MSALIDPDAWCIKESKITPAIGNGFHPTAPVKESQIYTFCFLNTDPLFIGYAARFQECSPFRSVFR